MTTVLNVQYVCLGRASQHMRSHSCLLSFLVQIRDMFRLTSTLPSIALREVSYVRGLSYIKCTLPLTRPTDNYVAIMASNHPSLAMLYTHL